jgi:hypothetical protein
MLPRSDGRPVYRCYGRLSGRNNCDQPPISRELVDAAAFDYFARTALDVDATRQQLADAQGRKLTELAELVAEAEREMQRADDRLVRVRRDYQNGRLDADDWREQRQQLTSEWEGAQAEAERLRSRTLEIGAISELRDVEQEVLEQLADLRAAVAGQVEAGAGLDAVRAALVRVFERFELVHIPTERQKLSDPGCEIPAPELAVLVAGSVGLAFGEYWLEPIVASHVLEGYERCWPVIRKTALLTSQTNSAQGR